MNPRTLIPAAAPTGGRKVALVVGVNKYDGLPNLKYAVNDADELAEVLRSPACGFDEVVLLTTGGATEPTAANIRGALATVLGGRLRADAVLLAFAGHGVQMEVRDPTGEEDERRFPFFCPSDADPLSVKYRTGHSDTMLNLDHLFEDLSSCAAGVKYVLMDACRNNLKAAGRTRSLAEAVVAIPSGVRAIFSCGRGQVAFEVDEFRHGLFFHHVINGLRGQALNHARAVTWPSLIDYVSNTVPEDALQRFKRVQSPAVLFNQEGATPVLVAAVEADPAKPPGRTRIPERIRVTSCLLRRSGLIQWRYLEGGTYPHYLVRVSLDGPDGELDSLERVVYNLGTSYAASPRGQYRTSRARAKSFSIDIWTCDDFQLQATLHFNDGTTRGRRHTLSFMAQLPYGDDEYVQVD